MLKVVMWDDDAAITHDPMRETPLMASWPMISICTSFNNHRMAGRIFVTFYTDVMPLETLQIHTVWFPALGDTKFMSWMILCHDAITHDSWRLMTSSPVIILTILAAISGHYILSDTTFIARLITWWPVLPSISDH